MIALLLTTTIGCTLVGVVVGWVLCLRSKFHLLQDRRALKQLMNQLITVAEEINTYLKISDLHEEEMD